MLLSGTYNYVTFFRNERCKFCAVLGLTHIKANTCIQVLCCAVVGCRSATQCPHEHQYVLNGHHTLFKTARWAQKCRSITQEPDEMERLSYYIYKHDDFSPPDSFGEMGEEIGVSK